MDSGPTRRRVSRNDEEHTFPIPRHDAPEFCKTSAQKRRARGIPGARCTRSPCAKVVSTRQSPRLHRKSPGIPARNGFNGLCRALPRRRIRLVTVIGELMVLRGPGRARNTSADLTPATGARTTRFCRPRLVFARRPRRHVHIRQSTDEDRSNIVRLRASIAHGKPPCDHSRARRCRVHRIPSQRS
jgi:hypothetical protein